MYKKNNSSRVKNDGDTYQDTELRDFLGFDPEANNESPTTNTRNFLTGGDQGNQGGVANIFKMLANNEHLQEGGIMKLLGML